MLGIESVLDVNRLCLTVTDGRADGRTLGADGPADGGRALAPSLG
jgi:hypothetical protein